MKNLIWIIALLFLFACSNNPEQKQTDQTQTPENQPSLAGENTKKDDNLVSETAYLPKNINAEKETDLPKSNVLAEYLEKLAPAVQTFKINDPKKEQWITGEKGTRVFFPAHIFALLNSEEPLIIELQEYYSAVDFLMGDLHTLSDGKILETGGMLKIIAKQGDQIVNLKPDSAYYVSFPNPKVEKKSGMLMFEGAGGTQGLNWQARPNPADFSLLYQGCDSVAIERIQKDTVKKLNAKFYPMGEQIQYANGKVMRDPQILENTWVQIGKETHYYQLSAYVNELFSQYFIENGSKYLNLDSLFLVGAKNWNVGIWDELMIDLNPKIGKPNHGIANFSMYECKQMENMIERFKAETKEKSIFLSSKKEYYRGDRKNFKIKFHLGDSQDRYLTKIYREILGYRPTTAQERDRCRRERDMNNNIESDYVFQVKHLGYINCDRFYNDRRPRVEMLVKSGLETQRVKLVLEEINSMINAEMDGNIISFRNLPKGMKAKLVILGIKDGKAVMHVSPLVIEKNTLEITDFEDFDLTKLASKI